jgi:hypothetical protein
VGEDVAVAVGEAVVVVVVGTAVVGEGVVMVVGAVISCASSVDRSSPSNRSTNTVANAATTMIDNFNKTRVRSVIASPCASLTTDHYSVSLPALHHLRSPTGPRQ